MIHPTALINPKAHIGKDVEIGPYCIVEGDVTLHEGVRLISHVTLAGRTEIGARTTIYPFASIGHPTQDLKYKGEASRLKIGEDNTIREYVTIQPGTAGGRMETVVGNNGLFMVGTHVAHDCVVGNNVIMANYATLAGHVVVEDFVIIGGLSGIHQFVRIGQHSIIGGLSAVDGDVVPFGLVKGERAKLSGLNLVGLKRRGFSRDSIEDLRKAYRMLFSQEGTLAERIEKTAESFTDNIEVMTLLGFVKVESKQGLCLPHNNE